MRLNSIKLAGFKSFADPTHFALPGQLVGVVGPNGCGKSNIMDAVRWVLGEGRSAELRATESLDVIFNGTTSRNPASRASVELVFDNADHRAGGQWRQFSEIAVKRVLSRDKGSSYFINGQAARLRDVHDVFLGTGLGPRGYAIIGQGTINQIIESSAEKRRLYLEEAAGVSKYKERRRETQSRLEKTRDNLDRVADIMVELLASLQKLEQQAEVATRYNTLNETATLRQHQLWFLKKRDAEADLASIREQGLQALNALEERVAELRHMEAAIENVRQQHYSAGDALNQAQGRLYEANTQVARLQAEIRYVVEGRSRVALRIEQLAGQIQQWSERAEQASAELAHLAQSDMQAAEHAEFLAAQLEEQAERVPTLQAVLDARRASANAQRAAVAHIQQQIQVLAVEQRSLGEHMQQQQRQLEKLQAEARLLAAPDEQALAQLQSQHAQASMDAEVAWAQLEQLQNDQPALEDERRARQDTLNAESARLSEINARLQALRALQDKLRTEGRLQPWLQKHGLESLQGLWTRIAVEPGWESALEAALRERLGALETSRLESVLAFGSSAEDAPPARMAFFAQPMPKLPNEVSGVWAALGMDKAPGVGIVPLASLLRVGDAGLKTVLEHWLAGVWAAPKLADALNARTALAAGHSIYVGAGHSVSTHSVSFYAADSQQSGMLARAQEIEQLDKQLRAQHLIHEQAREALARSEAACAQVAQQLNSCREQASAASARVHQLEVQLVQMRQQAQQVRSRQQQIQADADEVHAALHTLQERQHTAAAQFETLDMQLADAQELHVQLEDQAIVAERSLNDAREQHRTLERQAQEARFNQQSLHTRQAELQRTLQTAREQAQSLVEEQQRVHDESSRLNDAAAQGGLQEALEVQSQREQELASLRSDYDGLAQQLRAHDELRAKIERDIEPMRQRITEFQLKEQAASLGSAQFDEQLSQAGADLAALAQSITEGNVRLHGLQGEIDRLHRDIAALGPVNLAALQELHAAQQRKVFLDAQTQDLTQAMHTLEAAIAKIDTQTRQLLMDTFNTVNAHFGRMFSQLFGGGQAQLTMTGEEVLEAGVEVMAQPPGKKNQNIHLLSGGEKALTAIALVFAIFQLNPAPFCLLDEVDAPLDDANTERYARLVASMSASTQFLFISHNKIAMEMAEQLVGVTMQERGVSRVVAVDMESALSMAQR